MVARSMVLAVGLMLLCGPLSAAGCPDTLKVEEILPVFLGSEGGIRFGVTARNVGKVPLTYVCVLTQTAVLIDGQAIRSDVENSLLSVVARDIAPGETTVRTIDMKAFDDRTQMNITRGRHTLQVRLGSNESAVLPFWWKP